MAEMELAAGGAKPVNDDEVLSGGAVAASTDQLVPDDGPRGEALMWEGGDFEGGWLAYRFNPVVLFVSVVAIWSFVIWCASDEEGAGEEIGEWQTWIVDKFTWFYVASFVFFGGFCAYMMFGKYGDLKLGRPEDEPDFNRATWFTMLFSAGIGIGLYFFGVSEPLSHYRAATSGGNRYWNDGDGSKEWKAVQALNLTWFHWGLAASSVYCVVGLPLAWFAHRKGFPMTMRTCFYPLLGEKIFGLWGDLIDSLAVIATMFGVATSLGLGTMQLNTGLNRLNGDIKDEDDDVQLVIIWIITAMATVSVVLGLDVGIRRLSEGNFIIGIFSLLFLLFVSDTWYLLNLIIETTGHHFQWLIQLSCQTDAFQQVGLSDAPAGKQGSQKAWMAGWTIFYWGWWVAWSPFVGVFIAQISKGRTVREFIMGNMIIPTAFTVFWLTIYGGLGLKIQLAGEYAGLSCSTTPKLLSCATGTNQLFEVIDNYPLSDFMTVITIIGIITYFVTSSDSASLVIDMITANGKRDPPKLQRILWACSEGAVASVLLKTGGRQSLSALQTASIASGLPFCLILVLMCWSFWRAVRMETGEYKPSPVTSWAYHFSDALIVDPMVSLKSTVAPCLQQYEYRERSGMNQGQSTIGKFFWLFVVFVPPVLVILFHILEVVNHGWAYVGWVVYVLFCLSGTYHRMQIRAQYGIEGNGFFDCMSYFLFYPVAVAQESLQVQKGPSPTNKMVEETDVMAV